MLTKAYAVALLSLVVLVTSASAGGKRKGIPTPPAGYVPDQATAIRVAEAVLIPIYGEKKVISERPFTAILNGDVWTVSGNLPKAEPGEIVMGGVASVRLSKRNGCILSVGHGK